MDFLVTMHHTHTQYLDYVILCLVYMSRVCACMCEDMCRLVHRSVGTREPQLKCLRLLYPFVVVYFETVSH